MWPTKAERAQDRGSSTQMLKAIGSARKTPAGRISRASAWRAAASVRMKRRMASAVPSAIQRVAMAAVRGDAMTVAALNADAKGQPDRLSGTTV